MSLTRDSKAVFTAAVKKFCDGGEQQSEIYEEVPVWL